MLLPLNLHTTSPIATLSLKQNKSRDLASEIFFRSKLFLFKNFRSLWNGTNLNYSPILNALLKTSLRRKTYFLFKKDFFFFIQDKFICFKLPQFFSSYQVIIRITLDLTDASSISRCSNSNLLILFKKVFFLKYFTLFIFIYIYITF